MNNRNRCVLWAGLILVQIWVAVYIVTAYGDPAGYNDFGDKIPGPEAWMIFPILFGIFLTGVVTTIMFAISLEEEDSEKKEG